MTSYKCLLANFRPIVLLVLLLPWVISRRYYAHEFYFSANLTTDHIAEFVSSKVSSHKKLAGGVVFIDAIPKSMTGKILRKDLKAEAVKQ